MNAEEMSAKLQEIGERWAAATPGPWYWNTYHMDNPYHASLHLMSNQGNRPSVMEFRRHGMQGALPSFAQFENGKPTGFIEPATAFWDRENMVIDHPDARAIASAPEDIEALLEIVRLKDEEIAGLTEEVLDYREGHTGERR